MGYCGSGLDTRNHMAMAMARGWFPSFFRSIRQLARHDSDVFIQGLGQIKQQLMLAYVHDMDVTL